MNNQALFKLSDNYKIESKIGSGGMGDIYLALDKRLDRYVAIKVLNFSQVDINEKNEFVNRFKTEAKAIARLNHQNIVGIYDFGEDENFYYIVMEYIDGKNLTTIVKNIKTKIPLRLISSIFYQTASALEYAHENNIIHRDVKPDNILLSRKGIIKLTDFGIAKLGEQVNKIDENNYLVGSILYSSPEQIRNSTNVDYRTDIYSLGITIYELISGQPPFANSKDTKELIQKIFSAQPDDLTIYYPELNLNFYSIIKKCLEKNPQDRYQSIKELKKDLRPFINDDVLDDVTYDLSLINSEQENISHINKSRSSTFMIKGKTFSTNSDKVFIDTEGFVNVSTVNEKIKSFEWIRTLLKNKNSDLRNIKFGKTNDLLNQITTKNSITGSFTGICILDDTYYIFVYDGFIIGSILDIGKKIIGDKAIESLPEMFENADIFSTLSEKSYYPILIYNILSSGLEIYKNLDDKNTDISFLIEKLYSKDESFSGIVEAKININQSKTIEFLHIEDDEIDKIVISNLLKKLNFNVNYTNANTLEKALLLIKEKKFDFILLDVFIKDSNSIDFIDLIKEFQDAPILVATSSEDPNVAISVMRKNNSKNQIIDYKIKRPDTKYFEELSNIIEYNVKDKLESVKRIEEDIFYFAFSNANNIFSIKVNKDNSVSIVNEELKELSKEYNFTFNIFRKRVDFLNTNIRSIVKDINIEKKYKNSINIVLNTILERNDKISADTQKAIDDNIKFEIEKDLKIDIIGYKFDINNLIEKSKYYSFSNWVVKNLFSIIHNQDDRNPYINIYEMLNKINYLSMFQEITGIDNKIHEFDCVLKDNSKNILAVANFCDSNGSKIDNFINNVISIKKINKSIKVAFFISNQDFYPDDIDLLNKYSKSSGFSFFDKLSKYKSIVRVDKEDFFHIILVHFNNKLNSFELIYPVI